MRPFNILCVALLQIARFIPCYILGRFVGNKSSVSAFGDLLFQFCNSLGGAFVKAGQLLSTRVDFVPSEIIQKLTRLQDKTRPIAVEQIIHVIESELKQNLFTVFSAFECHPIACGSIAQIHRGVIRESGLVVAIKVMRPGIRAVLATDVRCIRICGAMLARIPGVKLPIKEAVDLVCDAMNLQTHFIKEVCSLRRFHELFANETHVRIPRPVDALCGDNVIVMEYLSGYSKLNDVKNGLGARQIAIKTGLRALYKMLFSEGLVHCDLHPGNILCNENGDIAILDFGFIAELGKEDVIYFARFFASIAFEDRLAAASIVKTTALKLEPCFSEAEFINDMGALLKRTSGADADQFQVANFVFDLFSIQRKNGVYGSPNFTLPILSLLSYEGLIKEVMPNLDFQQEAVPFVTDKLASSAALF